MAKVMHCDRYVKADVTRLESSLSVYTIQWAYSGKCRHCCKDFVYWQGEYANGNRGNITEPKVTDLAAWKRRIEQGDFKPEPQLTSQYSQEISRGADMIRNGQYQLKLTNAQRWHKGRQLTNDELIERGILEIW